MPMLQPIGTREHVIRARCTAEVASPAPLVAAATVIAVASLLLLLPMAQFIITTFGGDHDLDQMMVRQMVSTGALAVTEVLPPPLENTRPPSEMAVEVVFGVSAQ